MVGGNSDLNDWWQQRESEAIEQSDRAIIVRYAVVLCPPPTCDRLVSAADLCLSLPPMYSRLESTTNLWSSRVCRRPMAVSYLPPTCGRLVSATYWD